MEDAQRPLDALKELAKTLTEPDTYPKRYVNKGIFVKANDYLPDVQDVNLPRFMQKNQQRYTEPLVPIHKSINDIMQMRSRTS